MNMFATRDKRCPHVQTMCYEATNLALVRGRSHKEIGACKSGD